MQSSLYIQLISDCQYAILSHNIKHLKLSEPDLLVLASRKSRADFIHSKIGHVVGPAASARREEIVVQSAAREEFRDAWILIPAACAPIHVESLVSQPFLNGGKTELSCVDYESGHSQRIA